MCVLLLFSLATVGIARYVQAILDAGLFHSIVAALKEKEDTMQRHAVVTVLNLVCCGSAHHICILIDLGVVKELCDMLTNSRLHLQILQCIYITKQS